MYDIKEDAVCTTCSSKSSLMIMSLNSSIAYICEGKSTLQHGDELKRSEPI